MNNCKTAFFVADPRRIEELRVPHLLEAESPYEIARVVTLAAVDYENFITDMLVERRFIGDFSLLCAEKPVFKCLFVKRRGENGGVLVVPRGERVKLAAYVELQ